MFSFWGPDVSGCTYYMEWHISIVCLFIIIIIGIEYDSQITN